MAKKYYQGYRHAKRRSKKGTAYKKVVPTRGLYKLISALKKGNVRSGGSLDREVKNYDLIDQTYTLTSTLASATTAPEVLNSVSLGDAATQRDGRKIICTKIMCQGHISFLGTTATDVNQRTGQARILCVIDHQANGVLPAASTILTSQTSLNSFADLNNTARFTKIYDKTFTVSLPVAQNSTANTYASFDKRIPFKFYVPLNIVTHFNAGTTADIANLRTNSICLFAINDGSLPGANMTFSTRLRYEG